MSRQSLFTSNFRRKVKEASDFAGKCLLLSGLLLIFIFVAVLPQYRYSFNAAIMDKTARAASIEEPKILLVGNSNLVFGIDSQMIEAELGMPVVNMGLHAGLGNVFLEQLARPYIKEGDIVVVSFTEYADDDAIFDPTLAWVTIENHFSLWYTVRPKDVPDMLQAFPTYFKKALTLWSNGDGNERNGEMYSRDAFNQYGDSSYPRISTQLDWTGRTVNVPPVNQTCIERLNRLNTYIESKGASMVIAAFPIPCGPATPEEEEYRAFWRELAGGLNCPVISDITDYFMDYQYFYDTQQHLTDEGTKIRTGQLVEDIKNWMKKA